MEQHHEPPRSHASDWHDHKSVPLCPRHHRGADGRHGLGSLELFEQMHGISVQAHIDRLRSWYPGNSWAEPHTES